MALNERISFCLKNAIARNENRGCSVMVRKNCKEVTFAAEGYADVNQKKPIARDSIFRLYSMSKVITSIAGMMLVERGILDLWRPVSDYLPGFKNQKVWTVTGLKKAERDAFVIDLFGMFAGLSYPDSDPVGQYAEKLFNENVQLMKQGKGMSTVEFCNRMGELPLAFNPGTKWRYSTCADVLGAVCEVASGKKFEDFLQEEIFSPLGMKDTAFYVPKEKKNRLVTAYQQDENGMHPYVNVLHLCIDEPETQPAFSSGGAGLFSTIDDYAAIGDMLISEGEYKGKRILSKETVAHMTTSQLTPDNSEGFWEELKGFGYGYLMRQAVEPGQCLGFTRPGEYGWDGWMGTHFANYPEEKMTILLMQNRVDTTYNSVPRQVKNVVLAAESNGEF